MFYVDEDVVSAVKEATRIFGTVGNIDINSDKKYMNVSICTRQFGKIWYGDISKQSIPELLNTLSKSIQQKAYILDDRFDFNSPVLVSN